MTAAMISALIRPVGFCLATGGLRFLQDYQQTQKLVPSLVDGGIVALEAVVALASVNGAAAGVANVRSSVAQPKGPVAA